MPCRRLLRSIHTRLNKSARSWSTVRQNRDLVLVAVGQQLRKGIIGLFHTRVGAANPTLGGIQNGEHRHERSIIYNADYPGRILTTVSDL